jgi:glycosyltransferase involved in cell wall biosynthesis
MNIIQQENLVTIKIVTYNRVKLLKRCVQSILTQSYKNINIIIFDDFSNDETEKYCNDLKKIHNIIYIRNRSNIGPRQNFQNALSYIHGDFCMLLADDDYIPENYISTCLNYLTSNSDISFVKGKTIWVDSDILLDCKNGNLHLNNKFLRLLKYYSNPGKYTFLYSLYKSNFVTKFHVFDIAPFDWHFEASLAYLGKFSIINSVNIYRSAKGVSSDKKELFKLFKLSKFSRLFPYLTISYNSAKHIFVNDVFRDINFICKIFFVFCVLLNSLFWFVFIHNFKVVRYNLLNFLLGKSLYQKMKDLSIKNKFV